MIKTAVSVALLLFTATSTTSAAEMGIRHMSGNSYRAVTNGRATLESNTTSQLSESAAQYGVNVKASSFSSKGLDVNPMTYRQTRGNPSSTTIVGGLDLNSSQAKVDGDLSSSFSVGESTLTGTTTDVYKEKFDFTGRTNNTFSELSTFVR